MADVQLEKGFVRTANRLEEAIVWAPFTATEYKIVGAIKRLTYGWRRRTVRISQTDLAEKCRTTANAHFRRSFESLVQHGVVIEVEGPIGRKPGAYALNKNFERWGKYSVPDAALDHAFADRPNNVDDSDRAKRRIAQATADEFQRDLGLDQDIDEDEDETGRRVPSDSDDDGSRSLPAQGQSTDEIEARRLPADGQSNFRSLPAGETLPARGGNLDRPQRGSHDGPNSASDNGLAPPKDIERQGKTAAVKKDGDGGGIGSTEYESRIVAAALAGVRTRWPDKILSTRHAGDVAAALMTAGVDVEFAVQTIRIALARKLGAAPGSIAWLKDRVLDANRDRQHQDMKFDSPAETPRRRKASTATSIGDLVAPDDPALRVEYDLARKAAGIAWGKDPQNRAAYTAVVEDSNKRFADMLSTSWGKTGRDQDVLDRCIDSASFPSFDQWKSERMGSEQASQSSTRKRR